MTPSRRRPDPVLGVPVRVLLGIWSVVLMGGFGVARWVNPDPRGFGTHTQLGLPDCAIQLVYSQPCPGCGMTTSFAQFVRGDFREAARANPAGLLLALVCVAMIPWSAICAVQGRYCMMETPLVVLAGTLGTIGLVALVHWGMRVLH